MKTLIATLAVASTLMAVTKAQSPSRERANSPASPKEKQVFALDEVFVEPPPNIQPIEALLLTRDAGPFMVLAKTFRGPDAERYAVALAQELRTEFALPAYILRRRDFANHKLARKAAPGAPAGRAEANAGIPKKDRAFEECAVLVGDEKTFEASQKLLHRVKSLKPACLDALPHIWNNRRHLKNAIRITNPYVPTAELFRRKPEIGVIEAKEDAQGRLNPPERARHLLLVFPPVEVGQ